MEITTTGISRNDCPPEQNDDRPRSNGQFIYLAGCVAGWGTVELRRASDNLLLNTYNFYIRVPLPPAIPTGLTGQSGNGWVTLDWNDAARATSYRVQQWDGRQNPPGWRTLPFRESHRPYAYGIRISGSGATVTGLEPVSYAHRVQAVNGRQESGWSEHITTQVYSGGILGFGDTAGTDPATPPPP